MKIKANSPIPYPVPVPNSMGMVRYLLALIVILSHFSDLTASYFFPPGFVLQAVGGFFAISGFLIYGLYLKNPSFPNFMRGRCLRVFPPYVATVLFFAMILCGVSTLSPSQYFSSGEFWKYLLANLSFLNFLQPTLPGVFETLPVHAVNGALWTMKVEWCLYFTVPLVIWFMARFRKLPGAVFLSLYLFSALYQCLFLYLNDLTGQTIYRIIGRQFLGQMNYFYSGVLLYFYFDFFMANRHRFALIALILLALFYKNPYFSATLLPGCVAILVIWLSFSGRWGWKEFGHPNVSYSIYICHVPIIQLVVLAGLPQKWGIPLSLLFALTVIVLFSIAIYFCLEKPLREFFKKKKKRVVAANTKS